jgi:hypothetical protein
VSWGFIWIMFVLKVPLVALILIVWWAIRQDPDKQSSGGDDDGGARLTLARAHPRRPFPRPPRRGPHGDPAPAAPTRVRTMRARSRSPRH